MDERPSLRAAPDAQPNAPLDNTIPIRSLKAQTDESYLKDKWRPNRTDFQQESNDVSVKSSQTDAQSKMPESVPSKPSQTDTSFLYDQYMRSRDPNKTQDSPSQTAMKTDPKAMGNIRYPTQYSADRQEGKTDEAINTSRRPSEPPMPSEMVSRMERCECRDLPLIPCPSRSLPIIIECNKAASSAFQSTCSKPSAQPSQDTSVWYSLESDTSNHPTCPPAARTVFCPMKTRPMREEPIPWRCTCSSARGRDKSCRSDYASLDYEPSSNMQSAQSKSTKCSCKSSAYRSNVKSTQSSKSLPCCKPSRTGPVTVVYCPLRNYVNGPTSIDIELGEVPNDVSNDNTNWKSARSNVSDNNTCMCSTVSDPAARQSTKSDKSALSDESSEGYIPTTATPWQSVKSNTTRDPTSGAVTPSYLTAASNAAARDSPESPASPEDTEMPEMAEKTDVPDGTAKTETAPTAWNSVKSKSCVCDPSMQSNTEKPSEPCFLSIESNPQAVTAWNSTKSNRTCVCDRSNRSRTPQPSEPRFLNIESNPEAITAWNSAKSNRTCACGRSNLETVTAWNSMKSNNNSCGCQTSNQVPIQTSKSQTCSRALRSNNTYSIVTSEKKNDSMRTCTCGSSSKSPVSKSSNTDQTTSRSRSVMAKVTCLCSSEQRANLGTTNREGDGGPPFARVEESNPCSDVSANDPYLVSATCTNNIGGEDDPNYKSCYTPSQGTKVVFIADAFSDCQSSSDTSLPTNTGYSTVRDQTVQESKSGEVVYCTDFKSDQYDCRSMKSALSCTCDKETANDDVSTRSGETPRSQEPAMKSAITCSCDKETVNDYNSTRSDQTPKSQDPGVKSAITCSCDKETVNDYNSTRSDQTPKSQNIAMKSAMTCSCGKTTVNDYNSTRSDQTPRSQVPGMKSAMTCSCGKMTVNDYNSTRSDQTPRSQVPGMKSAMTCSCGKMTVNDYNSTRSDQTPRSQDPGMKSAMTCSCGKETVHDYKSARSDQDPCSCGKTSKYDVSMDAKSLESESVGVVMSCNTATVCVDKDTFERLAKAQARERLLNMVKLVTSNADPSINRGEVAQHIIRELTLMLRRDEEEAEEPKLCYEDCMEAVQRGERPVKKSQEKSQAQLDRLQCLEKMEQYLQTCFPPEKTMEVREIGAFEIDPDFDPFRKSPAVSEPESRDIQTFRSCYTDVEARFMTPCTPSKAELAVTPKGDGVSKSSSPPGADEDIASDLPQSPGAPDALSRGSGEPQASGQPSIRASGESQGSPQPSVGPDATTRISAEPRASPPPSDTPDATNSGEPQASTQQSDGTDGSPQVTEATDGANPPSPGREGSTGTGSGPKVLGDGTDDASAQPSGAADGSPRPNEATAVVPCGNEVCPDAQSQRKLCDVDASDPLSPLTDRERLLCEYLLRRMCELCDEDQEDEDYAGDGDGDCGGRSPPSQPCLCCHCRALVCDNQCKTVAKVVDSAAYDPVAEMKFFIDSVVFDLQAMEHVMKKNLLSPKSPKPSPYMGNAPGESFPVTILDVSSLGCRALYVRWELQDCTGVGGYEIYVDGHLTNRFYSHRHEAGVISNVDVTKRHQIILRAQAIGQEFAGVDGCGGGGGGGCNAMMNAHPEMRVGAQQPWTPSVYFYEP